jgi:hypothetical protein
LDLMRAYAMIRTKDEFRPFVLDREHVYTMEQALERMRGLIGYVGDWATLTSFLPEGWDVTPMARRSSTGGAFRGRAGDGQARPADPAAGRDLCPHRTAAERRVTDPEEQTLFDAPPMGEQERMVEAILFASAEPVTVADLVSRMPHGADPAEALVHLKKRYEGRGVNLVKVGDAWALRTAPIWVS